jgi:hypothetical protein
MVGLEWYVGAGVDWYAGIGLALWAKAECCTG